MPRTDAGNLQVMGKNGTLRQRLDFTAPVALIDANAVRSQVDMTDRLISKMRALIEYGAR